MMVRTGLLFLSLLSLILMLIACQRPAVSAVSIDQGDATVQVGQQLSLSATVTATGGASAGVLWSSSDETIASVSSSGVVTAVDVGEVEITARSAFDTSRSDSVMVRVVTAAVTYTGEGRVSALSNADGVVVVESETLGTRFEIRVEDAAERRLAGREVVYFEDDLGLVNVQAFSPFGEDGLSFFVAAPEDLGIDPVGGAEVGTQVVISATVIITIKVVGMALTAYGVGKSIWAADAATQEVNGTLSKSVVDCEPPYEGLCMCLRPSEIAALYDAQANRANALWSLGQTAAIGTLLEVTGARAAEQFGENAEALVGVAGIAVDATEFAWASPFEVHSDLEMLSVELGLFEAFERDVPMRVVVLDFERTHNPAPGAIDYEWGGIVLTGESCSGSEGNGRVVGSMTYALSPAEPLAHEDLEVRVRLDPAEEGVHVSFSTMTTSRWRRALQGSGQRMDTRETNRDGEVVFRVPSMLGAAGATTQFAIAAYERGQVIVDSFEWGGLIYHRGVPDEVSPLVRVFEVDRAPVTAQREATFRLQAVDLLANYSAADDLVCEVDFGNGTVKTVRPCYEPESYPSVSHTFASPGLYEVRVTATRESTGLSDEVVRVVRVNYAVPPTIVSLAVSPWKVWSDERVRVQWRITNEASEDLECVLIPDVEVRGNEIVLDPCPLQGERWVDVEDVGLRSGHFRVGSARLGGASRSFAYEVQEAGTVRAAISVFPSGVEFAIGDTVQLSAGASDDPVGGSIRAYSFSAVGASSVLGSANTDSPFWSYTFTELGAHSLCVTVFDDLGGSDWACAMVNALSLPRGTATIGGYTVTDPFNSIVEFNVSALDDSGRVMTGGVISDPYVTDLNVGSATARVCGDIVPFGDVTADIVMDASGSLQTYDPGNLRGPAAKQFVSRLGPSDRAAVASFTSSFTRWQALTSDQALLDAAIDQATRAAGGTAIWDAVASSADYLAAEPAENRVIVLFTDGRDGSSSRSVSDAVAAAQAASARVFSIGLGSSATLDFGNLQDLARRTGGSFASVVDAESLEDLFDSQFNAAVGAGCVEVDFDLDGGIRPLSLVNLSFTLNFTVDGVARSVPYVMEIPDPASVPISVSLEPPSVTLLTNATQLFTATVSGVADTSVSWSATCGSLSGSGRTTTYTAPGVPGSCVVTATSIADSSASAIADVVVEGVPEWSLSETEHVIEGAVGRVPAATSLVLTNTGSGAGVFGVTSSWPWLDVAPSSGTLRPQESVTLVLTSSEPCADSGVTNATLFVAGDASTTEASLVRSCSRLLWHFATSGSVGAPALDFDGNIIAAETSGTVYSITPSGELRWELFVGGSIETAPTVLSDGSIHVDNQTEHFLLSVAGDVLVRWPSCMNGTNRRSSVEGAGGVLIYSQVCSRQVEARSRSGERLWAFDLDSGSSAGSWAMPINSAPAVTHDGTVVVTTYDWLSGRNGAVTAITPAGELQWRHETGHRIGGSPAIDANGNVYVVFRTSSDSAAIYSYSSGGTLRWTFALEAGYLQAGQDPVIRSDNTILVKEYAEGGLLALSPSGSVLWRQQAMSGVGRMSNPMPVVASDGSTYLVGNYWLDRVLSTGNVGWSFDLRGMPQPTDWGHPLLTDGGLLVVGAYGGVSAYVSDSNGLSVGGWPSFQRSTRNSGR